MVLILAGIGSETAKQMLANSGLVAPPPFGDNFYDVLRATRDQVVGGLPRAEFKRNVLSTGESAELPIDLHSGDCKRFFVFTQRGAEIQVTGGNVPGVVMTHEGSEPHMSYGRLCLAKGTFLDGPIVLAVTMKKANAPTLFVAEAYMLPDKMIPQR